MDVQELDADYVNVVGHKVYCAGRLQRPGGLRWPGDRHRCRRNDCPVRVGVEGFFPHAFRPCLALRCVAQFYGPRSGALYARGLGKEAGAPLYPALFGGGQERNYRPGTENVGMIAGLGEAARLVSEHLEVYAARMASARDALEKTLQVC